MFKVCAFAGKKKYVGRGAREVTRRIYGGKPLRRKGQRKGGDGERRIAGLRARDLGLTKEQFERLLRARDMHKRERERSVSRGSVRSVGQEVCRGTRSGY